MQNDRMADYLHSLETTEDCFLNEMRSYAMEQDVPIVRLETESFLRTMIKMLRPESILEIGAAIGYSSIVMAKAGSSEITTIENYEKRIPIAKENIKKSGLEDRIHLIEGDAGKILKELVEEKKQYDFIFLDAAKGQYLIWLPDILKLMKQGSVLVTDNVLQEKTVLESRFTIPRRERTTHERMRAYLYQIKHDPALESSVLNVGDGVSVSVKL